MPPRAGARDERGGLRYAQRSTTVHGIESFWSLCKRGHYGTCHRTSVQRLRRCLAELSGRRNSRNADTPTQMRGLALGLAGQLLTWKMLADRFGCSASD